MCKFFFDHLYIEINHITILETRKYWKHIQLRRKEKIMCKSLYDLFGFSGSRN